MTDAKVLPTQLLFNPPLVVGTRQGVKSYCIEHLTQGNHLLTIATPNPEQVVQAHLDPHFLQLLQQFHLLLPDGAGLIWAGKFLNLPLRERVTGIDLTGDILRWCRENHVSVLLIGGSGYSPVSGEIIKITVQESTVFWWQNVTRHKFPSAEEFRLVLQQYRPAVVFVAFGAPWQEQWIQHFQEVFESEGVRLVMSVGGAFDVLTGGIPRAPQLMQQLGLEFLWRLFQEPSRWKRQLRLFQFIGLVWKEKQRTLAKSQP